MADFSQLGQFNIPIPQISSSDVSDLLLQQAMLERQRQREISDDLRNIASTLLANRELSHRMELETKANLRAEEQLKLAQEESKRQEGMVPLLKRQIAQQIVGSQEEIKLKRRQERSAFFLEAAKIAQEKGVSVEDKKTAIFARGRTLGFTEAEIESELRKLFKPGVAGKLTKMLSKIKGETVPSTSLLGAGVGFTSFGLGLGESLGQQLRPTTPEVKESARLLKEFTQQIGRSLQKTLSPELRSEAEDLGIEGLE